MGNTFLALALSLLAHPHLVDGKLASPSAAALFAAARLAGAAASAAPGAAAVAPAGPAKAAAPLAAPPRANGHASVPTRPAAPALPARPASVEQAAAVSRAAASGAAVRPAVTSVWRPAPGGASPAVRPAAASVGAWRLWFELHAPDLARLLASLNLAGLIKVLCMAGNVLVQVSPYPQVRRWERRGCTGEADAAPYVSIAFGGWQWCFYGAFAYLVTKRSGFLILVHSNCLGALLGTYYTAAFHKNCRHQRSLSSLNWYLSAVSSLALLQLCSLMALPAERALFLSGLISSFCSFVGAISMLVTVPAVLRSGDSRSIPGPMVVANFLSALVWCLCGWMLADPLVIGPNVVAALAGLVCMYVKLQFPSDPKLAEQEEPDEAAAIIASLAGASKGGRRAAADEFTPLGAAARGAASPGAAAAPAYAAAAPCSDGTGGTF